jgi:transposase-like protein
MNCPECKSNKIQKNGKKRGKQNYRCVQCGRQFITEYNQSQGYSDEFKRECLKLYVNGMGLRAIERVKGVHNTTVMTWVKEVGKLLPNAYAPETTPQVGELDELETFVGQKKTKSPKGYRFAYGLGRR